MPKLEAMGPCFALTTGLPARRRPEGGLGFAPESGFTLVARAGHVRPGERGRGRERRGLAPILLAAMMTIGCGRAPAPGHVAPPAATSVTGALSK